MENTTIGFENDEIFLLSAEEYEKYKNNVPLLDHLWWLRSPIYYQDHPSVVLDNGSVRYYGLDVYRACNAVRPALKLSNIESQNIRAGDRLDKYHFPWIYLGDGIVISETPIAAHRFDEESNDYGKSEVRQFLLNWLKERKDERN